MFFKYHTTGCLICEKDIIELTSARALKCEICGKKRESTNLCEKNHYVCDKCYNAQIQTEHIVEHVLETRSTNPIIIADEIMEKLDIEMHNIELKFVIIASLLAAYKNAGGKIDLVESLKNAHERLKDLSEERCKTLGCDSAPVYSGVFISIIAESSEHMKKEWHLTNKAISQCFDKVSKNGGKGCSKRNAYICLQVITDFVRKKFGITMEKTEEYQCNFKERNLPCKEKKCPFFVE